MNYKYNINQQILLEKVNLTKMPAGTTNRKFQIVHSKFNKSTTIKLCKITQFINWLAPLQDICQELYEVTEDQLDGKYVWMIGQNPAYYLQYQIDSYAILKGRGKIILVWKPKYLEFPSVSKSLDFGEEPKKIKSMEITSMKSIGDQAGKLQENIRQFLIKFYGTQYFTTKEQEFETKLMTELKNYVSRISKTSYWHCAIDDHQSIEVTSKVGPYLKLRIKGVHEKYDKDIIIFSHQGKKQYYLRGKKIQLLSFFAMLMIFVAVISCNEGDTEGVCAYRSEMMVGGAAIMMGMMGMRVAGRAQNKKKIQAKIKKLESQK